jgi:Family of unknown function (DUF6338)
MDIGSLEGALLFLILLLPGAIGYSLMQALTILPEQRSEGARFISAAAWSVAALALIEIAVSLIHSSPFGNYLIQPVADGAIRGNISGNVAIRYLVLVFVAILLPTAMRWLTRRRKVERLFKGRTLVEPTLYRALQYAPANRHLSSGRAVPYVRLRTEDTEVEGWLRWISYGTRDDASVIIRSRMDYSVTWVPIRTIRCLTFVDLSNEEIARED